MSDKPTLRAHMRSQLAALSARQRQDWDTEILQKLAIHMPFTSADIVALYLPLLHEVDCRPFIAGLTAQSVTTCLPCITAHDQPLSFRQYKPGDSLKKGLCKTDEPLDSAPLVTPTHAIIPLLGFSDGNVRLGLGGGFYDRTLNALPDLKTIGVAYQMQYIPKLYAEPHDKRLDMIVTEDRIYFADRL